VLRDVLAAEVNRLTELGLRVCRTDPALRDTTRRGLREALVEVLAGFEVYRAYLPPPDPLTTRRATTSTPPSTRRCRWRRSAPRDRRRARLVLAEGPSGPHAAEFVTRFQQTCGPVHGQGRGGHRFYRYHRLSALNEVGGDPGHFGCRSRSSTRPALTRRSTGRCR
jgi:(1->4)-alpha-D-glucan 1-alpha-D-glucosylmutase